MTFEKQSYITKSGKRMVLYKIDKYMASSPFQSLKNLNCLVVGRRFCSLFVKKGLYFEYKKTRCVLINLPYDFLTFRLHCFGLGLGESFAEFAVVRLLPAYTKFVSYAVPWKCWAFHQKLEKNIQALKISRFLQKRWTRHRRNLSMERSQITLRTDQPTSFGLFLAFGRVSSR